MLALRRRIRTVVEPVLGTRLTIVAEGPRRSVRDVEAVVLDEVDRCDPLLNVFRADSELRQWRDDPATRATVSAELAAVLAAAAAWQRRSNGAFNVSTGALTRRWEQAAAEGIVPDGDELQALAASSQQCPFEVHERDVQKTGDCRDVNVNALAKGHIVELAAMRAWAELGLHRLIVDAGGDIRHLGEPGVNVGIENPTTVDDTTAPIARVSLANAAMATSGRSRRGFDVKGRWHSHILDPRTGQPVGHCMSASVIAPDTATADAVATVASVLTLDAAIAFVDADESLACLLVDANNERRASARWPGVGLNAG